MATVRVELRWRGKLWQVPADNLGDAVAWVIRWRRSTLRRIGEVGLDVLGKDIERRILA